MIKCLKKRGRGLKYKRVAALYFGSFNPLHYGHLAVVEYVVTHVQLDEFLFVLSPHNPFKSSSQLENADIRLENLKKSIAQFKENLKNKIPLMGSKIGVSDVEFGMPEPRYTINTLELLERQNPDTQFCIVVGADTFAQMERWHRAQDVLSRYRIIVYPRKGYRVKTKCRKYGAIYLEEAPLNDISSTQIRENLSK